MGKVKVQSWAVYQSPMKGTPLGMQVVCTQAEWEAMDRAKPGVYTLVQGHIGNEGEAERLARGTSGDKPKRAVKGLEAIDTAAAALR